MDAASKQARVFVCIKPFRLIVIIVSKAEGYLRKVHPKGAPQGEDPALPSNIRTSWKMLSWGRLQSTIWEVCQEPTLGRST